MRAGKHTIPLAEQPKGIIDYRHPEVKVVLVKEVVHPMVFGRVE